ncbi:MAG TPA: DUF5677 domain-containing protein [Candidatus Saccharimonadales bacterium]|nr:DUF5677 domain-containing protein [Candidatus Saccharimonadales bacterium]
MQEEKISLSEKNKNKLILLAEMIDTGANEFTKEIKLTNLTLKNTLLYLNFAAVNNYSEGIYTLCADLRPFPAIVILRSVVEAFINTGYILTHNSDKRAVLFSMEDCYYKKGLVNEVLVFLGKYPNFEKDDFTRDNFTLVLEKIDKQIEIYKKKYKLGYTNRKDFEKDYQKKLLERARDADRRIRRPDFEHIYLFAYRYFSEFGHLSARGLDHFVTKDHTGQHEVIVSQHDDIEHILAMTYTIYLYFLNELKKRKMLSSNFPFSKFDKNWKEFSAV